MIVAKTIADESRNAFVGLRAGIHTGVAPCAVIEVNEEEILRFVETLIEEIIELDPNRNFSLFVCGDACGCDFQQ